MSFPLNRRQSCGKPGRTLLIGLGLSLGFLPGCQTGSRIVFPDKIPSIKVNPPASAANLIQSNTSQEPAKPIQPTEAAIQQVSFARDVVGLAEWIAVAMDRNPELAAVRNEVDMAATKIPQVGSLGDPMVDIVTWPIFPNVEQQAGGRMIADVGISQEVPWKGKRESRVGQASGEVSRLQSKLAAAELKVANEVKQAYYDCWLASQKLQIAKDDQRFLENLLELSQNRYEAGTGGQQEFLRIKAEIGVNATEQSRLITDQQLALAEFSRVIHSPSETSLEGMSFLQDLGESTLPTWDVVAAQALAANPELHARWAEVQRDQWRVKESRLNYYPDLTYSAGWGVMTARRALAPTADGIDNLTAGVSFNLPARIAARDAALRESQLQVEKGLHEWERQRSQLQRDVKQLHSQLEGTESQLQQYLETIVPSLEQALEITTTAYEANRATLSELIELRRELLRLRSMQRDLQAEWHKLRADLSLLMAEPL